LTVEEKLHQLKITRLRDRAERFNDVDVGLLLEEDLDQISLSPFTGSWKKDLSEQLIRK
jgi:hypothetical protein